MHVGQVVLYLVEACLAITDAAQDCPKINNGTNNVTESGKFNKYTKLTCAVDIMAVFAGFGWTSYFIAAMCQSCRAGGGPALPGSMCAADVLAMVAALMDLGEGATAVGMDCKWATNTTQELLDASHIYHNGTAPDQTALGWCVIDPIQAAYWLARAAVFIIGATKSCPTGDWEDCSIDTLYVISSFGWAAAFLAMAASDCATQMNAKAQCAGDISNLLAAVTMVSAQGITFKQGGCAPNQARPAPYNGLGSTDEQGLGSTDKQVSSEGFVQKLKSWLHM
jgi:hypothetical protein